MAEPVTLAHVEAMAAQLPLAERLKLVAHVCEQLSVALPATTLERQAKVPEGQEQAEQIEQWLTECEAVSELWTGEFDSAADLRRLRDER